MDNDTITGNGLPVYDPAMTASALAAARLNQLSPVWAKAEIALGLTAAVAGLKLLMGEVPSSIAGGALMVLGLYLAMAGHRSHLYQSQNRQTAYLIQVIRAQMRGSG